MARRRSSSLPRDPRLALIAAVIALAGAYFARQNRQSEPPANGARRTTAAGRRAAPARNNGDAQNETPGTLPAAPAARLASGQAAIGSFNVKWFGTEGPNPRVENDVRDIAQVIKNTDAALLGLEEIGDTAMMDRLLRYLPGYKYLLGTSGRGQKCAMLWDTGRASVGRAAEWPDVNAGLTKSDGSLRAPLVAQARVGAFDFLFVVIHSKAMFDAKSMRTRREQHRRLRARLDEWVRNNGDKDVIVVGDFNDFPGSPALAELTSERGAGGAGFVNAGARLPDEAITHLSPNGRIDYVLLSSPAVSQEEWTGQAFTYPKPKGAERKRYEEGVSDHLPTWATFNVARDNDP